jgi:hypothetical protein
MAESNGHSDKKGKDESEELHHVCTYENDDDDETFHSFGSDSKPEDIVQEKTHAQDQIIPSNEAILEENLTNDSKFDPNNLNSNPCIHNWLDNQCIDENSASTLKVQQCVNNSNTSISDGTDGNQNEQARISAHPCKFSESASCFKDSGNINYHRNWQEVKMLSINDVNYPSEQAPMSGNPNIFSDSASCFSDSDTSTVIYRRDWSITSRYPYQANARTPLERSISRTDECPFHKEEIIKYVCMPCNKLACQACCTIDHKNCHAPAYIPSLIVKPEFKFDEKCNKFEEDLDDIQNRLKISKGKAQSNLKVCEIMKINAKAQFKRQRDELNRLFECFERDFDRKISKIENHNKEKIKELMSKQERIDEQLQNTILDYDQRKEEGNSSRIFTKIEMSKEIVDALNTGLASIEMDNEVDRYIYKPSEDVMDFKQKISELGKIQIIDSESKSDVTGVKTINMKTETDQKSCQISGLVLLSERHLLAVDFANSTIKVVDIFNNTDVISVPVMPAPFDVTMVSDQVSTCDKDKVNGELVLTLPKENKLRVMNYTLPSSFTDKRDIETNGMCRAVLYHDGKLFVTFPHLGKIEIVDMNGRLLKKIRCATFNIGQLFQPLSITMDMTEGKLFVSDKDSHTVFCMNTDGDVIASFNDYDLVEPRGLCVNMTGAVFVCSFATHKIYHLSSNCQLISTMTVADDTSPAPFPFSIAYSDENNAIYVGQFAKDCIKAYTLG